MMSKRKDAPVRMFAEGTKVPIDRTRSEIETLLRTHGASRLITGWDSDGSGHVVCSMHNRMLKWVVTPPDAKSKRFSKDHNGKALAPSKATQAIDAESRRRWRALLLIIKAKLEVIAGGDSTFENEFLANIMLHDGSTAGQWLVPQLESSYRDGGMPRLLGSGS